MANRRSSLATSRYSADASAYVRATRQAINGRNQAVRIPREFELPGDDAIIRKDGNKLIIEAAPPRSLIALLATLEPLSEAFPPIPDETPDELDI